MKKIALLIIILAIIACCLFPPWRRIYKERGSNIRKFEPVGYSFIAHPPEAPGYDSLGEFKLYVKADTIDYGRLAVQLGLFLFLGIVLVFSKYIFPRQKL